MLTLDEIRELKKEPLLVHMQDASVILETLEAALLVVEAAKRFHDDSARFCGDGDIADLTAALIPFQRGEDK